MKNFLGLLLCLLICAVALPSFLLAESNYDFLTQKESIDSDSISMIKIQLNNASLNQELASKRSEKTHREKLRNLYFQSAPANVNFSPSLSTKALVDYQSGDLEQAELELRSVIQNHPMLADARAALSALLWKKGCFGEAESHWAAAYGLDNRYMQRDWLLKVRHWPPEPVNDLLTFIDLKSK